MPTFATMFSGGGGAAIGIQQAGALPLWAIEYDAAIAAVYRQNLGDHIIVDDVANVDFSMLPAPDVLQASPVCKNFSQAKTNGKESDIDIRSAQAVCRAIVTLAPRVFLLENVWQYRESVAFKLICRALDHGGYMWHFEHLNAADFGVPQTRRRLILRAVRDSLLPGWPAPLPWVGWYAAIGHALIPNDLKPYQTRRIAGAPLRALVDTNNDSRAPTVRTPHEPSPSIPSSWWRRHASQGVWLWDGQHGNISPRQGALLQSLPATYLLPNDTRLAGEIVGNMVPSLLMWNVVTPLL